MKLDTSLFEGVMEDERDTEWRGMPEFNQPDNGALRQIIVSFDTEEGIEEFARLVGQNITKKTKSIWFPQREKNDVVDLFWVDKRVTQDGGDAT
jgi:hypothetical protein